MNEHEYRRLLARNDSFKVECALYQPDIDSYIGLFWYHEETKELIAWARKPIPEHSLDCFFDLDHKDTWNKLKYHMDTYTDDWFMDRKYKEYSFDRIPRGRVAYYRDNDENDPMARIRIFPRYKLKELELHRTTQYNLVLEKFNLKSAVILCDQHKSGY
jgi:hypothetical protein